MLTALFHPSHHQPSTQRKFRCNYYTNYFAISNRFFRKSLHALFTPLGHLSKNYTFRLTLLVVFLISRKLKGRHHELGSRSSNFRRPIYYTHEERRFGSIALQSNYFVVTQKNTNKNIKVCHESDVFPHFYDDDDDVPKTKGRIDLRVRLKCHDLIEQHA